MIRNKAGTAADRGQRDQQEVILLERVATRDKHAFEQLYVRYHPQLSRYLGRLMRRPDMVEEAVNDTMLVVWEKAGTFEGRSKVSTWITGIAYLKGIKMLDKLRLMPEQNALDIDEQAGLEESTNLISRLGLEEWIASGLDSISADQRSVIELTYFSGFSYQEIAEVMDCPVNTVKTRMFHARRRLQRLLPALSDSRLAVAADLNDGVEVEQ
ncbi:MAG: sigma-70 family RNA polymerase sigma factor [Pseudomonadales bacterium]|nr:sigma-70 family RNA polymerase sigma factor [Pseudomonadales bacterium]